MVARSGVRRWFQMACAPDERGVRVGLGQLGDRSRRVIGVAQDGEAVLVGVLVDRLVVLAEDAVFMAGGMNLDAAEALILHPAAQFRHH